MYGACDRARSLISLEVDGELSEIGAQRLHLHLEECAACSAYRTDIQVLTSRLRQAPLEAPAHGVRILARRRSVALVTRAQLGAAAALAVAVVGSASLVGSSLEQRTDSPAGVQTAQSSLQGPGMVSTATLSMPPGRPFSLTLGADFVLL